MNKWHRKKHFPPRTRSCPFDCIRTVKELVAQLKDEYENYLKGTLRPERV